MGLGVEILHKEMVGSSDIGSATSVTPPAARFQIATFEVPMGDESTIANATANKVFLDSAEVSNAVFHEELHYPIWLMDLLQGANDPHHLVVAYDVTTGRAAATGKLRTSGVFAKFQKVSTLAAFRRMGSAEQVMEVLLDTAATRYPQHVPFLTCRIAVAPWYEKMGFQVVGRPYPLTDEVPSDRGKELHPDLQVPRRHSHPTLHCGA